MSDGFLARWSRRKRDEARRPAEVTPEAAVPVAAASVPVADDAALSPEELAQLPSLDALTAATDLTPFLRAGVPRALRNAALRRMWSIDPAIRDYVSEAREYAYDWNTPGGVPGTGGAISAEDVRAMVEKVFGGGEEKADPEPVENDVAAEGAASSLPPGRDEALAPLVGDGESEEPQVRREDEGASQEEPHPAPPPRLGRPTGCVGDEVAVLPHTEIGGAHDQGRYAAGVEQVPRSSPKPAGELPASPRLRRHGGATPI